MCDHDVRRVAERVGRESLTFCCDDLRALFALGLCLARHRALHALRELDVLQLDERDQYAPVLGCAIENLANARVHTVGLGQRLVESVLTDDLAQRCLSDLIDRGVDILDRDERLHRVDHSKVGDGGDIDADVVARDDALRLDRHRDDPQ